jgi:hypothetical protein
MSEMLQNDNPLVVVQFPGSLIPDDLHVEQVPGNTFEDSRLSSPEYTRYLLIRALGELGCEVAVARGVSSYQEGGLWCGVVKSPETPNELVVATINPANIRAIYNETSKGLVLPESYAGIPQLNSESVMNYVRGNYKQALLKYDERVWPEGQIITGEGVDISAFEGGRTIVRAYAFGDPSNKENTRLLIASQTGSTEFQKKDGTTGKKPIWACHGIDEESSPKSRSIREQIKAIYNEVRAGSRASSLELALQINFYMGDDPNQVVPINVRASEIMPPNSSTDPELAAQVQQLRARQLHRMATQNEGDN